MTNPIAIVLGLLILAALAADALFLHWNLPVVIGNDVWLGVGVTLLPGVWHSFWAEAGDALVGEVSTVNDDMTDNVFEAPVGRFARIDEDEAPWRLLVSDYGGF